MPNAKPKEKAASRATRRPWSNDDFRKLKSLAHESAPEIAKQLNRTVGAVYQQAAKRSVHIGTAGRKLASKASKARSKAPRKR
jgi:hypothetical protein